MITWGGAALRVRPANERMHGGVPVGFQVLVHLVEVLQDL
jgi:hypothetical protein